MARRVAGSPRKMRGETLWGGPEAAAALGWRTSKARGGGALACITRAPFEVPEPHRRDTNTASTSIPHSGCQSPFRDRMVCRPPPTHAGHAAECDALGPPWATMWAREPSLGYLPMRDEGDGTSTPSSSSGGADPSTQEAVAGAVASTECTTTPNVKSVAEALRALPCVARTCAGLPAVHGPQHAAVALWRAYRLSLSPHLELSRSALATPAQ